MPSPTFYLLTFLPSSLPSSSPLPPPPLSSFLFIVRLLFLLSLLSVSRFLLSLDTLGHWTLFAFTLTFVS